MTLTTTVTTNHERQCCYVQDDQGLGFLGAKGDGNEPSRMSRKRQVPEISHCSRYAEMSLVQFDAHKDNFDAADAETVKFSHHVTTPKTTMR